MEGADSAKTQKWPLSGERVQVVLRGWTLVGRQVLKGHQEPDHKGLPGQFCCVTLANRPVFGPQKKNKWSLGILELEVIAAISFLGSWDQDPKWGKFQSMELCLAGQGKAIARKGWAVATAGPNDGEAWLLSLPTPHTYRRSAQTPFLNRDPTHGGNLRSLAGHKTKIQRSG